MIVDTKTRFENLDITLLRQQKLELLTIYSERITHEQNEAIQGILGLLDVIQEQIVEDGTATEEEVFGPKDDEGLTEVQQYGGKR